MPISRKYSESALSRKIHTDLRRYQGRAKRCKADCTAGARLPSTAWLYERKPLYSTVSRVLAFSGWQDKGSVAKNSSRELAHRDQFVTIRTQQAITGLHKSQRW